MKVIFPTYAEALEYLARQGAGFTIAPALDPIMGAAWRVTIGY